MDKVILSKLFSNSQEKLVYKVVIDILEAYYREFDKPLLKRYRKHVIPLAIKLY